MEIGKKSFIKVLKILLLTGYGLHYCLNFLASPLVSYSFIFISILTLLTIISDDFELSFLSLIAFAFIEGQGRVIFSYHFIFRILFDLFSTLFTLKTFLNKKKIIDISLIPKPFIIFFLLHTIWFLINLFNPTGAPPLIAFAASKYYIVPFLLFFALVLRRELFTTQFIMKTGKLIVALSVMSCLLAIYQLFKGESSVYNISHNYINLFEKYEGFKGAFWRPWGTGHVAGAMGMYLCLTIGLVITYFGNKGKIYTYIIFPSVLLLSWFVLYTSQVRAFMIRHSLILMGVGLVHIYFSRAKHRILISGMMGLLLLGVTVSAIDPEIFLSNENPSIQMASKRFMSLFSSDITKSRSNSDVVFRRISTQVNWPFGYGPGMITNFLPQIDQRRQQITWIDKDYLWSGDNFLIFTFLELGIGAVFYLMLFLLAPLTIIYRIRKLNKVHHVDNIRIACSCVVVLSVSILGNWGTVGLSFNPESFFYWIFTAIGWSVTMKSTEDRQIAA